MNTTSRLRVRAEWEPYDTVLIAWPHRDTDWAPMMDEITECYLNLARAIAVESRLRLLVVTPEPDHVGQLLKDLPPERLIVFKCPTNDTWTRDYGPISADIESPRSEAPDQDVAEGGSKANERTAPAVLDFQFNGWGLKFAANLDNMVNLRMLHAKLLKAKYIPRLSFVFEGGSMEVDGEGTMLSTTDCLMSLNRNGIVTEDQLRRYFSEALGIHTLHLLHHGSLKGDDTDSHIDTLARLAPGDTILYVKSYRPNDCHTVELEAMEQELMALRTRKGTPYNLIALPLPNPIHDSNGDRLPATYANFLITPSTVLMPTYGQPDNDRMAHQMLEIAFAGRRVIDVDCRPLIRQHGSLHCATMQIPAGSLAI